jgi:hypothetical protein
LRISTIELAGIITVTAILAQTLFSALNSSTMSVLKISQDIVEQQLKVVIFLALMMQEKG